MSSAFKHALVSLFTFIILSVITYFSFLSLTEILDSPEKFFGVGTTRDEASEPLIYILLIVVNVLFSYIIYLLLSAKSRAELVTEIKTKSLNNSLNELSKLYIESPIPYMTLNSKGEIIDPNKAALRFFGSLTSEIEGKNIFGFAQKEDKEIAEKLFRFYESKLPINKEELRFVTKSGRVRWARLSVFRLDGKIHGGKVGLATLVDTTEEKELENAKSAFVSLASHQLRTPAATIKWYTDMLISGNLGSFNPKQREYLDRIYRVNENMVDLVDTLLNISRIESGTIQIDKKETNISEVIENILLELSSFIQQKNLSVHRDYGASKIIMSDPKWLRIVLQNLISNAVKYTNSGGHVFIRFKELHGKNVFIIEDDGIGIPEKDKDKIFGKMYRAENARTVSEAQGTGLGLYLVKSIIMSMEGNIEFESVENKGSIFTINF